MTGLVMVAASGLAREALAVVHGTGAYDDVVLVDDAEETWGGVVNGCEVVGGLDMVREYAGHDVVVCAGRGSSRHSLVHRLDRLGVDGDRYAVLIHPSVDVPRTCTIGRGSILLAHAALTTHVTIGRHVVVMPNATVTHDDVVDDYATLCARVALGGNVHVGTGAYLGMNSSVRQGLSVGAQSVLGMGAALLRDLPAGEVWAGVPARALTWTKEAP